MFSHSVFTQCEYIDPALQQADMAFMNNAP